jgi:hypothetical protein
MMTVPRRWNWAWLPWHSASIAEQLWSLVSGLWSLVVSGKQECPSSRVGTSSGPPAAVPQSLGKICNRPLDAPLRRDDLRVGLTRPVNPVSSHAAFNRESTERT